MHPLTVALAGLAGLVAAGVASAQTPPAPTGIPNGLSGPGGTETFTAAPNVPNYGGETNLGAAPTGRIGGSPAATVRPKPQRHR